MRTVDPAEPSEDLRWVVATAEQNEPVATAAADRAVAALGMATEHLRTATIALQMHRPESELIEAIAAVNRAVQRVGLHLKHIQDRLPHDADEGQMRSRIRQLREMLKGPEFEALQGLDTALTKGREPAETGWRESLPDLQHRLMSLRRGIQAVARDLAERDARRIAQQNPAALGSVEQSPRLGRAAALIERLQAKSLASVRELTDVQLGMFDERPRRLNTALPLEELKPYATTEASPSTAAGTDLAAVLEHLSGDRQEQPLAAVFLLTDAAHTHPGAADPREVAAKLSGTPVHIVPLGNTRHLRDVILQSVYAPGVAMRNDEIVIEVSFQAHDCEGEVCTVQLLQEGAVIDFRDVLIDSEFTSRTVRFARQVPAVGRERFQVAIPPLEEEVAEENNFDEFEVHVTRSDIQVLLADLRPRWEYRYLTQLFRRDAKIACDELLFHPRLIATGRREESKALPLTIDEWDQYDVVMLGDLPVDRLPVAAQESLVAYLRQRGGTLVLIAGGEAMPHAFMNHPLEEVLPVQRVEGSAATDAGGFAFRVTDEGRKHHALMIGESDEETAQAWDFVNRFVPLHELSPWRRPRPAAQTLIAAVPRGSLDEQADAADSAFVCWQAVGRGRVVYLSGPESYRLRFLRGDRLHYRFWGQLLRWAIASDLSAGSELVRIRTDKTRYNSRESAHVRVTMTDEQGEPITADELSAHVTSAQHERTVPLTADPTIPGEYRAEIASLPPGVYRVEPTGAAIDALVSKDGDERLSTSFTVHEDLPMELIDTRSDRALAQQIAGITGGQVLPPTAIEEVLALTNLEPIVSESVQRQPLWVQWKYLWIVFGCLQVEWAIRKWKGLS
jgi:hypothetical protein